MKKCILIGALFHCFVVLYGQSSDAYAPPTVVPQTPEVASLLKYSETPISYSTGVPNIAIPIASISSRELSVPVSISYHAGGHRVTEESTWVGLGWNLSAGGQISRTVKGAVDDHSPTGFLYHSTVQEVKQACANNTTVNGLNCAQLQQNESNYDYMPDDFNYSMMGMSGRFMFDQNRDGSNPQGHIIQFPEKNVIIQPTFAPVIVTNGVTDARKRIIAWDITDTNGTVYHFEEGNIFLKSTNTVYEGGGSMPVFSNPPEATNINYTETWDLTKITTLSGDEITFEYHRPQVEIGTTGQYHLFNEYNCTASDEQVSAEIDGTGTPTYNTDKSLVTYSATERSYTQLEKITSSQGYIEFVRSTAQREDTQFEKYALERIKVYSTATSPASLVQDVELIQSYFDATPSSNNEFIGAFNSHGISSNNIVANQSSFLNKRLKLDEVKFHSVDPTTTSNDSYSYFIDYNDTELPHKRSMGQDHWGFYNGADNNATLIPHFTIDFMLSQVAIQFIFSTSNLTANRNVNTAYSNASVIKSITYPEGGKTTYTFESNQNTQSGITEFFGGLRIKTIETSANDIVTNRRNFEYSIGHILSRPIYYAVGVNNVHTMRSQSWQPLLTTQGSYVNYINVKEIEGFTKKTGPPQNPVIETVERETQREYSQVTGNLNDWDVPYVNEWSANQLKFVQYGENSKIKKVQFYTRGVYSDPTVGVINVWPITQTWTLGDLTNPFLLSNFTPGACSSNCFIQTDSIYPGRKIPYSDTTTLYEGGQTLTTQTISTYDGKPFHFNPTKTVTTQSDGTTVETRYKYPYEMGNVALTNENKVNTLLLTEVIKDSVLLQAVKTNYASFDSIQRKQSVQTGSYQQAVTAPGGFGLAGNLPIATTNFEDRLVYHGYYPNGNIQEVSKKDGTHIVYIWGYNQTVPVAKIENATYSQVSAYVTNIQTLSNADDDRTIASIGNEGALRTALDNLRSVPALSNTMITTFTYDPLIGVTSITDPRGNIIYYEYDGFNRLIGVKDKDGNIVSENKYHYKNE